MICGFRIHRVLLRWSRAHPFWKASLSSYSDSNWRIDWGDLRMYKCIGKGGFGEVRGSSSSSICGYGGVEDNQDDRNSYNSCDEVLNDGACLQVFKGVWRGTDVAVKRLLHQDIGKDSGMLDSFCQEVIITMRNVHHVTCAR